MTKKIEVAVTQLNLITDMKFLRGKMGMLTILLLILMKGTDGPPVPPNTGPPVPPNTGPPVIVIKACAGEDQTLMTKDESAQEVIMTSDWIFSNIDATINGVTICIIQSPGNFSVDRLYSNKVEYCNTTSIILKNISLQDMGYYKVKFLKEKIQDTESLPIFLSVSDTPTKQCKPDIKILSGNMLNCSTQCEQFDVEWTQNKGDVVGNGSILQVDCLPKNESFSCCLKSKDMECYKGDKSDLCAPIPPSYCTENRPGENVPDVHADKVPDNSGSNMLGLLALLIIPVILVVICVLHPKEILPCPTMCRDKSIPCCSVSTQEPHADDKNVQIPDESVPMLANGQKPDADDNDDQVPEETVPVLGNGKTPDADDDDVQIPEPHADDKDVQAPEKTFPRSDADGQQVLQQDITSPMLDVGQEQVADVQHIQEQDPVRETEEEGTEHQPNSETTNEIQELRHASVCKICFTGRMNVLLLPCKHIATCDNCCSNLKNCPVCRTQIDDKIENVLFE
ncbi:hypothetical protein ACJMK2_026045 [Sinanodonta woodiana]|uniref:RING-type domain-containing protein n=1 Tax=Sinanodonta woodiana TaxID=1069815 RepID=A0ABD3XK60_SINWO